MIQMRRELAIPMAASRDMEVPLDLVPLETAVDATRVDGISPAEARALLELLPRVPAHLAQHMADMDVLLLVRKPAGVFVAEGLVLGDAAGGLTVALVHPQLPACLLSLQQVAREDVVAGSVLDVDAQRVARHADDDVQVQLQLVRNAFLDAEVVALGAFEPGAELGEGQEGADGEDHDGPLPAAAGRRGVRPLGFGWFAQSVCCDNFGRNISAMAGIRKASKVLRPPFRPGFSAKASSSSCCDANPFMAKNRRGVIKRQRQT